MPKKCPKCQAENPDAGTVCNACGWLLAMPHEPAAAAPGPTGAAAQPPLGPPAEETGHPSEKLLWKGRAAYKSTLDLWLLWCLAGLAAGTLYFWIDPDNSPRIRSLVGVLALVVIFPPGLWLLVKMLWARWATGYRLTEERLFIDRGIISRTTDQTELIRIDDVRVRQGPIDRILGVGDVIVFSTDATDGSLVVRGVKNPTMVAEHIRTHMRRLRKRGLYVESL